MRWLPLWAAYAVLLVITARCSKNSDALLPGRVGVTVQALAYVATYVSAVAIVGFGGLSYVYGMQMLLVAAGVVWLGTWFVYRYLAWPTRLWQKRLDARTPAELLAKAYGSPGLQVFLGAVSALLLIVYGSAVFKGAAVMIAGVQPLSVNEALVLLVVIVGLSVTWGGLRGVLYTEALQGLVMVLGVGFLLFAVLRETGGPAAGIMKLAALPATRAANNGFLAMSGGSGGLNVVFLTLVTGVGIWAQPQIIQRHFALRGRSEVKKAIPLALLANSIVVGGAFFVGALSRVLLGDSLANPDTVLPTLVHTLLPALGQQLFALAIVSASLSTASALLHIASGSIGRDVMKIELAGWKWKVMVVCCTAASGLFALKSSSIISMICTTSWTLLACAIMVPYLTLLAYGPKAGASSALCSSLCGFGVSAAWYLCIYAPTAVAAPGIGIPSYAAAVHPIMPGIAASLAVFLLRAETWALFSPSKA